jgi:hypothetical protein
MSETVLTPGAGAAGTRKVSFLLGVGILFLPYVFAWFLLRTGYSTLARIVSFSWLAFLVFFIALGPHSSPSTPSATTGSRASNGTKLVNAEATKGSSASPSPESATPGSSWSYSQDVDQMRNATTYYAQVTSDNELEFDFPYNGGATGKIVVRKSPVHGTDVMLQMTKGQFICNSYSGDTIKAKFDNGPILRFGCGEPADATTGVLFIEGASKFIAALKSSKKVVLEAQFFQEGNRQLTFQTQGLEWKH